MKILVIVLNGGFGKPVGHEALYYVAVFLIILAMGFVIYHLCLPHYFEKILCLYEKIAEVVRKKITK